MAIVIRSVKRFFAHPAMQASAVEYSAFGL